MSTLRKRVLNNTFTTETAWHRFHACRHALEAAVYADGSSGRSVVERYTTALSELDDVTAAALREWGTDWVAELTPDSLRTEVQAFSAWLEHMPTFTLYVPVAMDDAGEAIIGAWCRDHIAEELLVELVVEPATVGGCAFVHSGTYHDWSLARRGEVDLPQVISQVVQEYGA